MERVVVKEIKKFVEENLFNKIDEFKIEEFFRNVFYVEVLSVYIDMYGDIVK